MYSCKEGVVHILRKHFYSTKFNLTSSFFTKIVFFCQNKKILTHHYILTKFHAAVSVHTQKKAQQIRETVDVDKKSAYVIYEWSPRNTWENDLWY